MVNRNHMVSFSDCYENRCFAPDALHRWNFNRADWVQFDHLCKEQLTLDTIELYDKPIVLFTDILCNIAKSCMPRTTANRRNAVRRNASQKVSLSKF